MAIKDTTRKPYIQDNDTSIKIGIDLPIRRGDETDGWFATTSKNFEVVINIIRNLLHSNVGERLFQAILGLNLRRLLFEHITNENLLGVQDAILDKIEFWLPFVEVRNIEVLSSQDSKDIGVNEIRVKIDFNIKQDPNTIDSVTMSYSGDISEETEPNYSADRTTNPQNQQGGGY